MQYIFLFLIFIFNIGCVHQIAIDKYYIPNQCPKFDKKIDIVVSQNQISEYRITKESLFTISKNLEYKKRFNNMIDKINTPKIILDKVKYPEKRIKQNFYVFRECPTYDMDLTATIVSSDNSSIPSLWIKQNDILKIQSFIKYKSDYNTMIQKINKYSEHIKK